MPRGTTVYLTGETVLSTGAKSSLTPAFPSSLPNLSELFIGCPPSLNEGESGVCTATALWSDGSMTPVLPTWSGGSPYASIGADGVLTATTVSGDQPAMVTADYTFAGVTRTTSATVMIVDLSVVTIMEPKNVNVSGPLAESPSLPIRLAWDPVATYTDGTPIPSGAIVDYSAYWTTDSTLSESSLMPLASSTLSLSVYFDPTRARNEAQPARVLHDPGEGLHREEIPPVRVHPVEGIQLRAIFPESTAGSKRINLAGAGPSKVSTALQRRSSMRQ